MEHYGKPADLAYLMQQWVNALLRADGFRQQLDPLTGIFTADESGYSPAADVLIDFTWRLAGVRRIDQELEWNVRPPAADVRSTFRLRVNPTLTAEINYGAGHANLLLNGRQFLKTASIVRLIYQPKGRPSTRRRHFCGEICGRASPRQEKSNLISRSKRNN